MLDEKHIIFQSVVEFIAKLILGFMHFNIQDFYSGISWKKFSLWVKEEKSKKRKNKILGTKNITKMKEERIKWKMKKKYFERRMRNKFPEESFKIWKMKEKKIKNLKTWRMKTN